MGEKIIKLLSNPTEEQIKIILGRISDLYHDPVHVIYEYIQNSIDSAVLLKKMGFHEKRYIFIHIDEINKQILIQDNCKGIKKEEVKKLLTQKIFESKKKNSPWLLGEFGFGVQSFRSWFKKLILITKHLDSQNAIMIDFNDSNARAIIKEEQELKLFGSLLDPTISYPLSDVFQEIGLQEWSDYLIRKLSIPQRRYGTDVILKGLKKKGHRISLTTIYENLKNELPIHFESYLRDELIEIFIIKWLKKGNKVYLLYDKIKPINYDSFFGKEIKGVIKDPNLNIDLATYLFKIVNKEHLKDKIKFRLLNKYLPRVYKLGMEINKIAYLLSFQNYMRKNFPNVDLSVWERPNLIGYINIIDKQVPLEISRVDILPSRKREILYREIAKLTEILVKEFNELSEKEISKKEEALSTLLTSIASKVLKDLELDLYGRTRIIKSSNGEQFVGKGSLKEGLIHNEKRDVLPTEYISDSQQSMEVSENKSSIPLDNNQINSEEDGISASSGKIRAKKIKQRGIIIEIQSLGEHNLPSVFSYAEKKIIINKDHPFYKQYLKEKKNRFTKAFYMYISLVFSPWIVEEVFDKFNIKEKADRVRYMIETAVKIEKMLDKTSDLLREV